MFARAVAVSVVALIALPLRARAQGLDGGEVAPTDAGTPEPAAAPPVPVAPAALEAPKKPLVEFFAGWGEGVGIKALAGDLSVSLRGRIQLRFTALVPNENSTSLRTNSFTVRRARLLLKAKYKDELAFTLQLAFAPEEQESDNTIPLRDVHLTWTRFRDLNIRVGQMKVPYDRQYLTSSSSLEFLDRGVGVGEFNLERDVGLMARSDDLFGLGLFGYQLVAMGGEGRNRIGINPGLLFGGRVTVTPLGKFKDDLVEADLERHGKPKLALAFSYVRNNATGREKSTHGKLFKNGVVSYDHLAADLLFKWQGLAVEGAWLWRRGDKAWLEGADGSFELTRSGWAWYAQASYAPMKWLSFGARYGDVFPLASPTGVHRSRELGGYLAGYFLGHDLKVQADYFYLANEDFTVGNHQVRLQVDAQF